MITDEESLQNQNIDIDSFINQFNINTDKEKKLKENIENEIIKINNIYDKINKEVTEYYLQKHEKLIKEEKGLKEQLENETTKVKEQLENYLSKSNNLLKISEKINKGIKSLENEQKNMIKTLSYISKINKTQNEMKILFQQLMRNVNINFNSEKDEKIIIEDYYFNGIFKPKDIDIKYAAYNSLYLSWKIKDELNILNVDKKQIKYIVEMRKENKQFNRIYEGNDSNCKIENLKISKKYEFRICSLYNNILGEWSEIKAFETKINCDSIILLHSKKPNDFLYKLYEWTRCKKFELLYRGSKDGTLSNNFHSKCDNQGPTLTLLNHEEGYIFGGYCSVDWKNRGSYTAAPDSFLFTLTNIYETEPMKFPLKNNNDGNAIYDGLNYLPIFGNGHDLWIQPNYSDNVSYTKFPYAYNDISGKGKSIFLGNQDNINNNNYGEFKLKEVEVFKAIK